MELKSVDGIETPDWESVRLALVAKIGDRQTEVGMAAFGSSQQVIKTLDLRQWNFELDQQNPVVALGIIPRSPQIKSVLAEAQPDSAAQKARLYVGDKIVKIDDQRLDG